MYVITTTHLDPMSGTVYYSSLAGKFKNQPTNCGIEENSSELRGALLATLQGLAWISDHWGTSDRFPVDVLTTSPVVANVLRETVSSGTLPDDENGDLWQLLLAKRAQFDLNFVTSHGASPHILTIWRWSSTPPIDAFLPPDR